MNPDHVASVAAARLTSAPPDLVRRGMNHVYRAGDVVIRVSPTDLDIASRRVAVARTLRTAGIPGPEPLDDAELIDGLAVSVWRHVESEPTTPVDWSAVGATTARLHALPPDTFGDLPRFDAAAWLDIDAGLDRLDALGLVEADDLAVLRRAHDDQTARSSAAFVSGEPFVVCHGDLVPQNVLARADGSFVILDWDEICLGPRAWDHAALLTWSDRWGGDPHVYADFAAGYGADLADDPHARLLADARLLAPTVNMLLAGEHDEAKAREGRVRLRYWRDEPDAPAWTER